MSNTLIDKSTKLSHFRAPVFPFYVPAGNIKTKGYGKRTLAKRFMNLFDRMIFVDLVRFLLVE